MRLYQIVSINIWLYVYRCASTMPSRHRLCWCLGGTKPEISYNAADNGGLQLVPMEVAEPMPTDAAELDAKFAELVVSSSSFRQRKRYVTCRGPSAGYSVMGRCATQFPHLCKEIPEPSQRLKTERVIYGNSVSLVVTDNDRK